MTSNNLHNKIKTRILLALIIIGLIFSSLFFFTACSTEETVDPPTYTYKDEDDALISNSDFTFGTADTALKNFPITSTSGWSRSKDSTGVSSSSKSGVIDVTTDGWKAAMSGLYTDSYYLDYLMYEYGFTKDQAKTAIKNSPEHSSDPDYKPTNDEIKNYIVDNNMITNVTNPKVKADATDNKVYMLNNYTSKIGWGAAQKLTSSSEVTVAKGKAVKLSVSVYTQNLVGLNNEYGASIRIAGSIAGHEQADYVIANIQTDGWQTFTIYVKGDAERDVTFKLALGLGYNIEYQTQGTAYFDDVNAEEIDVDEIPSTNVISEDDQKIPYGSNQAKIIKYNNIVDAQGVQDTTVIYDMGLAKVADYNKDITPSLNGSFTKSNSDKTSQDKGFATSTATLTSDSNKYVATLENAGYSISVSSTDFEVQPESYVQVSFLLNNNLSKFGSTEITIDVIETTNGLNKKYPAIATFSDVNKNAEDFTRCSIILKNNFDEVEYAGQNRTFEIVVVLGPTKISEADKITDYASGSVTLKGFEIATGKTYQYDDDNNETANYALYELYTELASSEPVALFAGFPNDYAATIEDTSANGLEVSAIDLGYIKTRPVVPKDYDGIIPNHIYMVNDNTASNKVNERSTIYGQNGSYAGIVNSKYDYYSYTKDSNQLPIQGEMLSGISQLEDDVQPLMIYNKDADSYGYISMNGTKHVAANSYAKVSVKVKVLDDAKAYIYLVDTTEKKVLSFVDFKPNTNGIKTIESQDRVQVNATDNLFELVVDSAKMADAVDGWLTVEFYIATGSEAKSFRIELWNGDRTGTNKSAGYVFFKDIAVSTATENFEPGSFTSSFVGNENPLAIAGKNSFTNGYLCYIRELTAIEKQFNKEYPEQAISYSSKIVWAKNDTIVYGVFNNLEVNENDPYDSIIEEEETEESGCAAETNPANFWLSFSSILLAVVLLGAIIMLFIKNIRRRRKANESDAKSHYTVKSRVRTSTKTEKKIEKEVEEDEIVEENEEVIEETEVEEQTEENLDEYVYGEVQDFGEDKKDSE